MIVGLVDHAKIAVLVNLDSVFCFPEAQLAKAKRHTISHKKVKKKNTKIILSIYPNSNMRITHRKWEQRLRSPS